MGLSYFDVYDVIRERITSGEYAAETRLTTAGLRRELGCEPDDVERGLEMLVDEALLLQGNTSAEFRIAAARARSKRQASFAADYASQGRTPTVRTIELSVASTDGDDELMDFFGAKTLIRHLQVQSVDGVPHAIADSYVPLAFLDGVHQQLTDGNADLWDLLADAGAYPTRKRESFLYDAPSPHERELLDIVSTPAVRVVRLDCLLWSDQTPVELCRLVDRADLYQFVYEVDIT